MADWYVAQSEVWARECRFPTSKDDARATRDLWKSVQRLAVRECEKLDKERRALEP